MDLVERLERTIRAHILRSMPPDPTARASGLPLHALLHDYAAWRTRFPAAIPRRIHISRELLQNPIRAGYGDGLAATLREIASGQDLSPRLSTGVRHAHELAVPPALAAHPGRRRKSRDLLLSEWGIHHLHLGTERGRLPQFVRRGQHVLFVAFRNSNAYVIDLLAHEPQDNWAALRILEIAVRNWPEAEIVHRVAGALGLVGGNVSDEDRQELRRAGANIGVEIDGAVYMSLGQMGDGAPFAAAQTAMRVSWILSGLRDGYGELVKELGDLARNQRLDAAGWRPVVHDDQFGFANDGVFVPYGSLTPQ